MTALSARLHPHPLYVWGVPNGNPYTDEFLQNGRKNRSGILQRFIAPSGGGTHNSQIRAVWTPSLCLLERRRTKRGLHDARYGLYERCVTFDGPDAYSASSPVRGSVLAGKIREVCDSIVKRVADSSVGGGGGGAGGSATIARMVVHFKVDGNGKIWALWSSSIRLFDGPRRPPVAFPSSSTASMSTSTQPSPWRGWTERAKRDAPSSPLNMNDVVRLASSVKLRPGANHDPSRELCNDATLSTCPSCDSIDDDADKFHPVPYKTIIAHFEKVMEMLTATTTADDDDEVFGTRRTTVQWPPDPLVVKAAGGVGFGTIAAIQDGSDEVGDSGRWRRSQSSEANSTYGQSSSGDGDGDGPRFDEEDITIPPVIRKMHKKLKVRGYRQYRSDPLFLHKTCRVCESCFLAYAELASTSFQITPPIRLLDHHDVGSGRRRKEKNSSQDAHNRGGQSPSIWVPVDDDNSYGGHDGYAWHHHSSETFPARGGFGKDKQHPGGESRAVSIGMSFPAAPELPPAITDPSQIKSDPPDRVDMQRVIQQREDAFYREIAKDNRPQGDHPLMHLIAAHERLSKAGSNKPSNRGKGKARNPYEETLELVDGTNTRRKARKNPKVVAAGKQEEDTEEVKTSKADEELLSSALEDIYERERKLAECNEEKEETKTIACQPAVVPLACAS